MAGVLCEEMGMRDWGLFERRRVDEDEGGVESTGLAQGLKQLKDRVKNHRTRYWTDKRTVRSPSIGSPSLPQRRKKKEKENGEGEQKQNKTHNTPPPPPTSSSSPPSSQKIPPTVPHSRPPATASPFVHFLWQTDADTAISPTPQSLPRLPPSHAHSRTPSLPRPSHPHRSGTAPQTSATHPLRAAPMP